MCPEPLWYACRTRARAEKHVDALLGRAGLETFLPLIERERSWSDRTKRVQFPLFPGYTFARFDLGQVAEVVRTRGLVEVVGRPSPVPVRDEELEAVRRCVEGVRESDQEPELVDLLEPGTPVRVVDGPFRGMRGSLVEVRGRRRVVVQLSAIRMAAGVEVERGMLENVA